MQTDTASADSTRTSARRDANPVAPGKPHEQQTDATPSPPKDSAPLHQAPSLPVYTLADVAQHTSRKDAWVAYRGVVYDVTEFLDGHPGGIDILLRHSGTDITVTFDDGDDHAHGDAARGLLSDYVIGTLAVQSPATAKGATGRDKGPAATDADTQRPSSVPVEFDPAIKTIFLQKDDNWDLIDLEKPIITQLWSTPMSLKQYLKLAHTPRFLKGGRVARFFESDFLEYCSRNQWYSVLGWIPVSCLLFYMAAQSLSTSIALPLFVFGIGLWTFMEYSIHRWLFHFDNWLPDNHVFICFHFLMHGVHHFLPMDPLRLVFPWPLTLILAIIFTYIIQIIVGSLPHTIVVVAGTIMGYVAYDLTHFYLHHAVPPYKYFRELKTYHLNHHYKDYQLGYGISSTFWDHVFGTVLQV